MLKTIKKIKKGVIPLFYFSWKEKMKHSFTISKIEQQTNW